MIDQRRVTIRASAGLYSPDRTTVLSWLLNKYFLNLDIQVFSCRPTRTHMLRFEHTDSDGVKREFHRHKGRQLRR